MPQSPSSSSSSEAERAALIEALQFYADGKHFAIHEADAWDTVSGEPTNFWEDESNTATVEDGSIAQMALASLAATPPSLPIDFKQASEQGVPRGDAQASKEMSRDEILHVWDAYVGEPTKNLPLTDSDKLAFARAILAKADLNSSPSPHPEEGALLLGGDEGGKKGGA